MRCFLLLGITLLTALALGQSSNTPQPASAPVPPETSQFDFWVGKWNAEGKSLNGTSWVETKGCKNEITHSFDGHVVQENFHGPGMHGMSVSVYNSAAKKWFQTWVDDQGGYIALHGGMTDGKMILETNPGPKGGMSRMVFSNITKDSFDWDWQSSKDSGKTWTLQWHLKYTRSES